MLGNQTPAQWIFVGCPPVPTRYTLRWVNKVALKKWRSNWTVQTLQELVELCEHKGLTSSTRTANQSLLQVICQLTGEYPHATVVDARAPKVGVKLQAVADT